MIEEKYKQLCDTPSDINENLPVLRKYAEKSETIVELGVRGIVSTWALLAGKPKMLLSVDVEHPSIFGGNIWDVIDAADEQGTAFSFNQISSLEILLPEHDMLFIDTIHTRDFLTQELARHAHLTKKYIAFHDTHHAALPEMMECINDFLEKNPGWKMEEDCTNNGGLTVIARV